VRCPSFDHRIDKAHRGIVGGDQPFARHQSVEERQHAIAFVHFQPGEKSRRDPGMDLAEVADGRPHPGGGGIEGHFASIGCHVGTPRG
jgi:hypothetical protein